MTSDRLTWNYYIPDQVWKARKLKVTVHCNMPFKILAMWELVLLSMAELTVSSFKCADLQLHLILWSTVRHTSR
jgi:hypothetical protein